MKHLKLLIWVVVMVVNIIDGIAQENKIKLSVGNKAPSLEGAVWIKGDPVTEFKKEHVYVVDFGFIGCVGCMKGWVTLTDLQKKYKGKATMIAIFTRHISAERVQKYIENIGDRMDYSIAFDPNVGEENGRTQNLLNTSWVKAAGLRGYPAVFLVNKEGKVAAIDPSTKNLDKYINQLIDDSFDPKDIVAREERESQHVLEIVNDVNKDFQKGNYQRALHGIDSLIKNGPENHKLARMEMKFKILLKMDEKEGLAYGWKVLNDYPWEKYPEDAWSLSKSWVFPILYDAEPHKKLKQPDYDLAIAMCMKTVEFVKDDRLKAMAYTNASWAYFAKGNPEMGEEMMANAIVLVKENKKMQNQFFNEERFSQKLEGYRQKYVQK